MLTPSECRGSDGHRSSVHLLMRPGLSLGSDFFCAEMGKGFTLYRLYWSYRGFSEGIFPLPLCLTEVCKQRGCKLVTLVLRGVSGRDKN